MKTKLPLLKSMVILFFSLPAFVSAQTSCQASFTVNVNQNVVTFTNTSSSATTPYYSWSFGDGTYASTTNATHTYANNGMYLACLTIYTIDSCTNSSCDTLTILSSGYTEVNNNYIRLENFPNPFSVVTTVNYYVFEPGQIEINVYNVLGNKVAALLNEKKATGNYNTQFYSENLPEGLYFLEMKSNSHRVVNKMNVIK